jgi:hypothetical protein
MKRIWDADELAAVWSLKQDELKLLKTKPERNHLGFVVQLKHYLLTGRFLHNRSDISDPPLHAYKSCRLCFTLFSKFKRDPP